MTYAITIENLTFAYGSGHPVLDIASLQVPTGERVFLHGPSGSGKTTLLGLIGGILTPTQGSLHILGSDICKMTPSKRDVYRGTHVGYIFQMFNLIPYLSVRENILLPLAFNKDRAARVGPRSPVDEAEHLAERLGLGPLLAKPVTALSVGQQQRVAAARALIGRPGLVIADEPTSALDTDHREAFIRLLFEACGADGTTLLFVSHDHSLARLFDRQISLPAINRIKP